MMFSPGSASPQEGAVGGGAGCQEAVQRKTIRVSLLFGSCCLSQQLLITSNQLLITYNKRDEGKHR